MLSFSHVKNGGIPHFGVQFSEKCGMMKVTDQPQTKEDTMESNAENVVQNIGAMAESISVFYNSLSRQVPKDVALVLTKHFMDLTIPRRTAPNPAAVQAAIAAALEAQKRAAQQKKPPEPPKSTPQAPENNPQNPEIS
jgi:Ni,Fe-hydrogenase III small subunit